MRTLLCATWAATSAQIPSRPAQSDPHERECYRVGNDVDAGQPTKTQSALR